ncbi:hypothetical protein [Azospirillum doebereinerae]
MRRVRAFAPTLTLPRWAGEGTAAERRQVFCPLPRPAGEGWGGGHHAPPYPPTFT